MLIHDWTRVNPGIYHDFHQAWIFTLKRALNAGVLPADYYALAEQITGGLGPDVLTLENVRPPSPRPEDQGPTPTTPATPDSGGLALATAPPKVRFTAEAEPDRYARRRSRISIRHKSGDQVVAVIEIVSPGNKASRHALRTFVAKAVELLDAGIHLLILDLFPPGPRDPDGIHGAIWSEYVGDDFSLPPGRPLTLVAYSAGELKQAFIEPVAAGEPLPEMPLFLEPRLYVPVPLDATYQAAFEAVPRRWQSVLQGG
jgi:hypothetical protein